MCYATVICCKTCNKLKAHYYGDGKCDQPYAIRTSPEHVILGRRFATPLCKKCQRRIRRDEGEYSEATLQSRMQQESAKCLLEYFNGERADPRTDDEIRNAEYAIRRADQAQRRAERERQMAQRTPGQSSWTHELRRAMPLVQQEPDRLDVELAIATEEGKILELRLSALDAYRGRTQAYLRGERLHDFAPGLDASDMRHLVYSGLAQVEDLELSEGLQLLTRLLQPFDECFARQKRLDERNSMPTEADREYCFSRLLTTQDPLAWPAGEIYGANATVQALPKIPGEERKDLEYRVNVLLYGRELAASVDLANARLDVLCARLQDIDARQSTPLFQPSFTFASSFQST